MNQPITIAAQIGMGEYIAYTNGCRKSQGTEEDLEPPSAEWWEEQQTRIFNTPSLTGVAGHA